MAREVVTVSKWHSTRPPSVELNSCGGAPTGNRSFAEQTLRNDNSRCDARRFGEHLLNRHLE